MTAQVPRKTLFMFFGPAIERVGNRQFDIGMASAQAMIMPAVTIFLARLYIRLL